MFPHEPDNHQISSQFIEVDINLMTPRQKKVKGLQLLVGFYSFVLMSVMCYLILIMYHFLIICKNGYGSNTDLIFLIRF